MKTRIIFLLLVSLFLKNCQTNDPEPEDEAQPITYFTLNADESFIGRYNDVWVLTTNNEGQNLDYQKITTGGKYEFIYSEDSVSDKIGIYILTLNDYNSDYEINGYLGIPTNSEWTLVYNYNHSSLPKIGHTQIDITNWPYKRLEVNIPMNNNTGGLASTSTTFIGGFVNDIIYEKISFEQFPIVKQLDTLLIANAEKDNDGRYMWVNGVRSDSTYNFDFYEDMIPYDNLVTYECPASATVYFSNVQSQKNGVTYHISLRLRNNNPTNFTQFGYVDGFEKHFTLMTLHNLYNFDEVTFKKIGNPVTQAELSFPEYDFSVQSNLIGNFQYNYSGNFDYRTSFWKIENSSTRFTIYEDVENPIKQIQALPEEILQIHNQIDLNDLEYDHTEFVTGIEGYSFEHLINETFKNAEKDTDRIFIWYTKY